MTFTEALQKIQELCDNSDNGVKIWHIATNALAKERQAEANGREKNLWVHNVLDWHKKFEVNIGVRPEPISEERFKLRQRILQEEVDELTQANDDGNFIAVCDAICDVLYVIIGTAIEFGLQDVIDKLFAEVHRSNMSKLDENGRPVKREDGKILKSELFIPPQLEKIIYE